MQKDRQKNHSFIAYLALFYSLLAPSAFCQNSYDLNGDIMEEIEKTLLFSDEEKSRMQMIAKPTTIMQEDEFQIGEKDENYNTNPQFEMEVKTSRISINTDTRTKERQAYNSALSGQYEAAIELYKQVLETESENSYAKLSLALLYQKMQQYAQAKVLYRELLKNNPKNKKEIISNMLAILSKESPRDALYLLMRLASQHPNSSYIFAQTALVYEDIKNYDKAAQYLQKAIALDPDRIDYIYNLAIIYDKSKNYEKALESYLEVVKSYKNNEKYASAVPISQVELRIESVKNKI